jgi:parvulin-like peptidyl-prolyl isomerase
MITHWFRRLVAPALVGALAVGGLAGCSSSASDAATINYTDASGKHTLHITRDDFEAELRSLTENKKFMKLLSTQDRFKGGDNKNSVDPDLSALWLTTLIRQKIIDAEFETQKLSVTQNDRDSALNDEEGQNGFGSKEVFTAFSKSLQNTLVEREARLIAVSSGCASNKAVGHILVNKKTDADLIYAALQKGARFADIAKAKSIDTGSAQQGGLLGCLSTGEFVKEFQQAAEKAPLDIPTKPVKSQFGYHVIIVRKWQPADSANPALAQGLQQAAFSALNARLASAKIKIDPRYGTWDKGGENQAAAVVPPKSPDVKEGRDSTTTTPSAVTTTPGG